MALNIPYTLSRRIVIVGAGFAGLTLAKKLSDSKYQVVLLDRNNYHMFQPLLYQVATSALNPSDVIFPIRNILKKHRNIYFRMAEVYSVSPQNNIIETSIGNIAYDFLVLANGSVTNFFQLDNIEAEALPMKNLSDAIAIRNKILKSFEGATTAKTHTERQALLNIVIVGGGTTGVEIAGAVAYMKRHIAPKEYPDLQLDDINIFLIEGGDRVLGTMSGKTSVESHNTLQKMGVQIIVNAIVDDYSHGKVIFKDGSYILSHNLIWTSGIKVEPIHGLRPRVASHNGRVLTDTLFRAAGHSNIFVIGDASIQRNDQYLDGYPQLASVAIAQAKHLATNLRRASHALPAKEFVYKPQPKMATIGRNHAFAEFKQFRLSGFIGWVAWLGVHLIAMMGFRHKFNVLSSWAWSYFTYDSPVNMIIEPPQPKAARSKKTTIKMRMF